jgi:hypothetical protein
MDWKTGVPNWGLFVVATLAVWIQWKDSKNAAVPDGGTLMSYLPVLLIIAAILVAALMNWRAFRSGQEPDPNKLIIHYARYGIGTRRWEYRNVTEIVRGYIKNGNSIDMTAGTKVLAIHTSGNQNIHS